MDRNHKKNIYLTRSERKTRRMLSLLLLAAVANVALAAECPCSVEGGTPEREKAKTNRYTVCPGSSDPFYIVSYYINWVTTSWTHSICVITPPSPFVMDQKRCFQGHSQSAKTGSYVI